MFGKQEPPKREIINEFEDFIGPKLDEKAMQLEQMRALTDQMGIPIPEAASELTRWELSSDEILERLEHTLRGDIYDSSKKTWTTPEKPIRMLNEDGIRAIRTTCDMIVNKISFLSNLTDDMILMMVRKIGINVAQLLYVNYKEFEVKKEYMTLIVNQTTFLIYVALQRALRGEERGSLRRSEKRNVIVNETPKAPEKKGFSLFGSGGK